MRLLLVVLFAWAWGTRGRKAKPRPPAWVYRPRVFEDVSGRRARRMRVLLWLGILLGCVWMLCGYGPLYLEVLP